ncbi:ABC transporter substrate-binding protein [Ancylobacter amanitiformis]|uniref:Iron(III) transport system substrate-binding protein n=1 Tax=Ancylobacter amanitiformis TaxID=217069 RepID=A0ABU0LWG4_9HYPH|nr:ABC transporter substrate-binding protein [Ancylobacter amanitiformis]MDQ0512938.1 iron(III) transport system substrate-binding protein [Ancylobacter amanitiformis]
MRMTIMRALAAGLLTAAASFGSAWAGGIPAGYPSSYADLVKAAKAEGAVSIYTSTDSAQAKALLEAFSAKYPGIKIEYNDLGTNGTYNRVISEAAAGQVGADVVWSSAMDLQMALATDNYIDLYVSPEAKALPAWASYKDMLYAATVEPIGMIYNTKALPEASVPKTRADLIKFLNDNRDTLRGKVATFDPEKSGSGFLHHTNDARATSTFWDLAKAFGAAGGRTYSSSGSMKETVVSGENVLAFNIIGSYALDWVKQSPNLGVAFGTDYTPAFSRVLAITKGAPHPNAAKLFIDFALSRDGQNALASNGLPSVRTDTDKGFNLATLNERVGGNLKPIALDEDLLEYMKPQVRVEFFKKWKASLAGS